MSPVTARKERPTPYTHKDFPSIMYRGEGESVSSQRFETPDELEESEHSDWRDTPVAKAAKKAPTVKKNGGGGGDSV